jgi:hypothetical protein
MICTFLPSCWLFEEKQSPLFLFLIYYFYILILKHKINTFIYVNTTLFPGSGRHCPLITLLPLPPGVSNISTVIAVGTSHTCIIAFWGGVKCWGSNDNGKLGYSSWSASPVDVQGA